MYEIILKVKNKPLKNDILLFNGKEYENMPLEKFLNPVNNKLLDLEKQLIEAQKTIENLKLDIKYLKGE